MRILALDLGKFNSVACDYETQSATHEFATLVTTPKAIHNLIADREPDRVVIEICSIAGWVCDLVRALEIEIEVANTSHEAWRWKNLKCKNDRQDALKLCRLSAMKQLSLVHVPARAVRQWRALINYRQHLVGRRTKIKNHIRDLVTRESIRMKLGKSGWSFKALEELGELAKPIEEVGVDELWRGELWIELQSLKEVGVLIRTVEKKLDELAANDHRVGLLRTILGVGPRLSEALVALFDDPMRFKNVKEVGAYLGLTPTQRQSGGANRLGRITHHGNTAIRSLLVEVSWIGLRYNPWMRETYEKVMRGSKTRKRIAIVAVARRLLIRCWAMLRDDTPWRMEPKKSCA